MCKCNPEIRTPFCGKGDCEWPKPEGTRVTKSKFKIERDLKAQAYAKCIHHGVEADYCCCLNKDENSFIDGADWGAAYANEWAQSKINELEKINFELSASQCVHPEALSVEEGRDFVFCKKEDELTELRAEKERAQCNFCKNTGEHFSPDVAEPIVVSCCKKSCVYGELIELRKDRERLLNALKYYSFTENYNEQWVWKDEARQEKVFYTAIDRDQGKRARVAIDFAMEKGK
jgi:hypothetical protein